MPFYVRGLTRIGSVLSGIFIAFIVSAYFLPECAATRLPERFGSLLKQINQEQRFICSSYNSSPIYLDEFEKTALDRTEVISRSLEKVRALIGIASDEVLLSKSELKCAKKAPGWLIACQSMYHVSITMIYARLWDLSTTPHHALASAVQKTTDDIFSMLICILQKRVIPLESVMDDVDMLMLLRDAVGVCKMATSENIVDDFGGESSRNHYWRSFVLMLIHLESFINTTLEMHQT